MIKPHTIITKQLLKLIGQLICSALLIISLGCNRQQTIVEIVPILESVCYTHYNSEFPRLLDVTPKWMVINDWNGYLKTDNWLQELLQLTPADFIESIYLIQVHKTAAYYLNPEIRITYNHLNGNCHMGLYQAPDHLVDDDKLHDQIILVKISNQWNIKSFSI